MNNEDTNKKNGKDVKEKKIDDNEIKNELESIKKLLILQLIKNGVPHAAVAKAAGMSTKTLYKFIPKNSSKTNNEEEENNNE